MTQITIDTEQVNANGVKFASKAEEVEALRQQADAMANELASAWRGDRANYFQNSWQELKPQLQNAVQALQQASVLLKQAANEFSQADARH